MRNYTKEIEEIDSKIARNHLKQIELMMNVFVEELHNHE